MLTFKNLNILCLIILFSFFVVNHFIDIPMTMFIVLIIVWFTLTSIGSFNIGWNYHLKALNKNISIKKRHVAITFDDGPNNIYTPQVLKLLKSYKAKASFFCIGKNIEMYPSVLKDIANQGHTIGNHTYTHSYSMGFFRKEKVIHEINKTKKLVEKILGKKMKLFRPPFGITNPSIAKAIQQEKKQVIGWNIRSLDTIINDENKILNRIKSKISPGSVILLHDTCEKSINVLKQLLLFLYENNYQSVTVDTLFNIDAYE
mgnify:CR=1 FL=1